jgi:hypothetical protein
MNGGVNDRPMIGTQCVYAGAVGEVRASYVTPQGVCVVGRYLRRDQGPSHFVGLWRDCRPLFGAAAA